MCAQCSSHELLRLLVEGRALLDGREALTVQYVPCCHNGGNPWALGASGGRLLGNDFATLILREVTLAEAGAGVCGLASEDMALA